MHIYKINQEKKFLKSVIHASLGCRILPYVGHFFFFFFFFFFFLNVNWMTRPKTEEGGKVTNATAATPPPKSSSFIYLFILSSASINEGAGISCLSQAAQ
jgi:hypothetical protein